MTGDTMGANEPVLRASGVRKTFEAADEIMVTPGLAEDLGYEVGDRVPFGVFRGPDGLFRGRRAAPSGPSSPASRSSSRR
jgi:hypothetical protein